MATARNAVYPLRLVATGGALAALAALLLSFPRPAMADGRARQKAAGAALTTGIGPTCQPDDQFFDLRGNLVDLYSGTVATPIGTTYSVSHLIGADTDGDGSTNCIFIDAVPPPGAPDDVVTFDGVAEFIRTDVAGTVPTAVEGTTDNTDGTHALEVFTSSPTSTELFPGGFVDAESGKPLTDACFLVGLQDPLDWPGVDTVTLAAITFLKDGGVVAGPLDVTSRFSDPWNGRFSVVLLNGAGADINGVKLEILAEKTPPNPLGACCVGGECIGDVMEISCDFQGGTWHFGASCGQNPNLPSPVCQQGTCSFDNGQPLDDLGAPASQHAPDGRFADAASDDFVLSAPGSDRCRMSQVRVWTTHPNATRAVDPLTDYQGLNITVYANAASKGPAGDPVADGTHSPDYFGAIVYSQTVPMTSIGATPLGPGTCTGDDLWRLDVPADFVLKKDTKYWMEAQPIMNFDELGNAALALSGAANGNPAEYISARSGVTVWQPVSGNAGACPAGSPPTPPAGTHRDIAFSLTGAEYVAAPPNDKCADAATVGDGVVSFSNQRAATDGPDEPEMCNFYQYTQVGSDVWFDYIAACTGNLKISLCGSDYDTKLAVYDGCGYCPPRGLPVACSEDAQLVCGLQSEVALPVNENECFTIRAGGFRGEQGFGIMTIRCQPPPPPMGACCNEDGVCLGTMSEVDCADDGGTWFAGENCATFSCPVSPPPNDQCDACIPVLTGVRYDGKSNHATGADISSCGINDSIDVWHCWTADRSGVASFDLCDSAYDTTVAVYDACGGLELACNDDACSTNSLVELLVDEGVTYYVRVSGFEGAVGNYSLLVKSGAEACCTPSGLYCAHRLPGVCSAAGGIPRGPGSFCLGDHNGNRIDDACEACPPAQIVHAVPPHGAVDARQPHAHNAALPRQGIGSPGEPGAAREPITLTLNPPVPGVANCFELCETAADPQLGANSIADVSYLGDGTYEMVLEHAVTAGAVTTIEYTGSGSFAEYTAHPANVDGDGASGPVDILAIIDILNLATPALWGEYSCDADHSGVCGPADILRVIDLLNGADLFDSWLGRQRPPNDSCP